MAEKYFSVGSMATLVHHRGPTTLPGEPPAPSGGATILCVHDVAGNGHVFSGVLDALADRHCPIAFDLPGHGRSGGLDSLGAIAAMTTHTKELADRLDVRAPVLLGDGMGAAVALQAAATWPDWPAAVVVVGGASLTPDPGPAAIEQVRQVTAGRARRQFDTSRLFARHPARGLRTGLRRVDEDRPTSHEGDLEALAGWDGTAIAGAVTVPVVVVVGEYEPPEAVAAAEVLAAAVRQGRVVTLDGAGRRGVAERPEQLAAIVAGVAAGARRDVLGRRGDRRRLRAPDSLGSGQDGVPDHGRVGKGRAR